MSMSDKTLHDSNHRAESESRFFLIRDTGRGSRRLVPRLVLGELPDRTFPIPLSPLQ